MRNQTTLTRLLFTAAALLCLIFAVRYAQTGAPTVEITVETAETDAQTPAVSPLTETTAETASETAEAPPQSVRESAEPAAETPAVQAETATSPRIPETEQVAAECRQLLIAEASGTDAVLTRWERKDGAWRSVGSETAAKVGRNGVSAEKVEGDGKTPSGCFPLTAAFGLEEKPDTQMPYRQVTQESYWVDDPASRFYNQWVEGTEEKDWSSAEHLADYANAYALAVAIGYNVDPVVQGHGSAIFLHCGGEKATSGCVAAPHEAMRAILAWLRPDENPMILITSAN